LDIFELVLKINLVGTFNVCRLVAAEMAKNTPNEDGLFFSSSLTHLFLLVLITSHTCCRRERCPHQHSLGGCV